VAMTYVQDVERQAPSEYSALLGECEELCTLAQGWMPMSMLTGPLIQWFLPGLDGTPWRNA